MLDFDTPAQTETVRSWRLLVTLAGHKEASTNYDLKALPSHFLMQLKPPPACPTFGEFVHDVQVRLAVPYDFDIRPCYWDRFSKQFLLLTNATFPDVVHSIFNSIVQGSHLDSRGNVRGSAYICLFISYSSYSL
jgi:hypothetical protein